MRRFCRHVSHRHPHARPSGLVLPLRPFSIVALQPTVVCGSVLVFVVGVNDNGDHTLKSSCFPLQTETIRNSCACPANTPKEDARHPGKVCVHICDRVRGERDGNRSVYVLRTYVGL